MVLPFPRIGIIFDIDELDKLGLGSYGYKAHRIFMTRVDPSKLPGCIIMHGDTRSTLSGSARQFCIAIYGMIIDVEYIKNVFGELEGQGLAHKDSRFIEKPQLDSEPLPEYGRIDALGVLITDSWDIDNHELCKAAGWKYKPEKIPSDLPAHLRNELKNLSDNKSIEAEAQPRPPASSKKWWQFWK